MTAIELRAQAQENRKSADSLAAIDPSAAMAMRVIAMDKEQQADRMEQPDLTKVVKDIQPLNL